MLISLSCWGTSASAQALTQNLKANPRPELNIFMFNIENKLFVFGVNKGIGGLVFPDGKGKLTAQVELKDDLTFILQLSERKLVQIGACKKVVSEKKDPTLNTYITLEAGNLLVAIDKALNFTQISESLGSSAYVAELKKNYRGVVMEQKDGKLTTSFVDKYGKILGAVAVDKEGKIEIIQ